MSKISTYSLADTPLQLSDRLIGTEAPRTPPTATPLATKNFSLGELLQLFSSNFPAATLQAVLDEGNTATQDMFITGEIVATLIKPTNIEDILGSQGTTFQILSKGTTGISWIDAPVDNLQTVLNAGNTATQNINLTGNITSTKIIPGNIQDYTTSIGTTGQVLTKSTSGIVWSNLPSSSTPGLPDVLAVNNTANNDIYVNSFYTNTGYGLLDDGTVIGQSFQFPGNLSYLTYYGSTFNLWELPNASGTIALTSDIPAAITLTTTGTSGPSTLIGSVLNIPNYATSGAQDLNDVLTIGNTSLLNAYVGELGLWDNANTGYMPISAVDNSFVFEDSTANKILAMEQGVFSFFKSNTIAANLSSTSLTISRNFAFPDASGTIALTSDLTGFVTSVGATGPITSSGGTTPTISTSMSTNKIIGRSTAGTGVMEEISVGTGLTLSGGTLSATATGGGIPHTTASGTDTYTATVTGVTSYADGDAYLVRFTNGNTTGCTLNINGLGAIALYRNNDGALIGGDIWAGAEMLCVYNSTTTAFQCIGTSSNSLFAYVTNADSVAITKGQPVYAFGGQGDRLTVKRALNTSDSTSAQTVGVVLTSSIAVNQKGIIIIQGLLDGLSILPTSTWADGDPVYLGTTAGSITNVKQYAPNHLVYLGTVTTASNGSAGRWYVRVQNGYELDELHNVQAQSPSLKDTLWYDSGVTPGQWKTASISSILGYTPLSSANNGLSLSGTVAQLGGTLLQSTTIDGGSSSAYNLTFTNGDFIISNGSGVGGARGNIILSNNRSIYWGSSSGNYIGADSGIGGFTYYAPPSTGKHTFYSSMNFANYGSGTKTGTATYNLSVTSTGNIIETAIPPVIPSLTAGSVLFSNGTTIAEDNANFFWNDSTKRLGIGTTTPYTSLTIQDSSSTQILLRSTTGIEGIESFAGGTLAKFDITTGGTYIYGPLTMFPSAGTITYSGQDVFYGNITSNFIPKKATIGFADSLIYDNGTNVGIGTTTPATELDVNGVITATGGNSTSWNAKQDALVSGTNIKTINGSSVLGSGDLTVSAAVGRHALIPLASGNVTNSVIISVNPLANTAFTTNRLITYPFIPSQSFTSSNLFINVTTLGVGSLCRIAVYDDLNGYPNSRLFVSSDLDCSTTGQKTATASISFVAGNIYWLAFHGGNVSAQTSAITQAQSISLKANTINSMANCVFYGLTFTTPTPTTFLAGQSFFSSALPYIGITKA